jgi:hypothetical protein
MGIMERMKNIALACALLISGCPSSVTRDDDAGGDPDAGAITDDAGMNALDGGDAGDVVVRGAVPFRTGQIVRVRIRDNSIPSVGPWQTRVLGDGEFELRFDDAMPRDVFGVFADGWFDDGDEACEDGEDPFRLFASNDFTSAVIVVNHMNADAATCADVATDP